LSPIDTESEIAALSSRLRSPDAGVRRVALLEFADAPEDGLVPTVVALLRDDPDSELRAEAARALAGCDAPEAVEGLALALTDEPAVRTAAAASLSELKNAASGARLLQYAEHADAFVSASALRTLKELRMPAAAHPALAALKHADASVRREAVGVLGWLKHISSLPGIARLAVEDPDAEVRRAATGALGIAAPDDHGAPAALIHALKDSAWQVREEAATTLGKFRAADSRIGPALRAAMQDDYWQVRLRAARSLGRLRDVSALPMLIEALLHSSGNLRKEAAIALGEVGEAAAIAALNAVTADPDPEVRKAARLALQRLEPLTSNAR
jgi:HEAT repeat protein